MHDDFALFSAQRQEDWETWAIRNVDASDRSVSLESKPTVLRQQIGVACSDFAAVPNGNLVMLNEDDTVTVYMAENNTTRRLALESSEGIDSPILIGATRDALFLIDSWQGLIREFSRRKRRPERIHDGISAPIETVGGENNLYLLDAGNPSEAGFVLAVGPTGEPERILGGLKEPLDIAFDGETVYVLDEDADGPVLLGIAAADPAEPTLVDLPNPEGFSPQQIAALTGEELLLYGEHDGEPMVLLYETDTGTVAVQTTIDERLVALTSATAGQAGIRSLGYGRTEAGDVWVFERSQENRKDPENTRYEGHLVGRFDSGERDLDWHRIAADISRATSGSHVDIRYYASNEDDAVSVTALSGVDDTRRKQLDRIGVETCWDLIEFTPRELGEVLEIPATERATLITEARELLREQFGQRDDTRGGTGLDDLLLKGATGRYLHVKIELVGSRQSSPQVHTLRAYCPRKTYLRYLPEIYQESGQSSEFLGRYLSVFETVFTEIEANIDRSTQYIDAHEIPKDYFPWLNRWFGGEAVLGRAWPETAQRELLERSTELYKLRGTKRGMLELIGLYFDHVEGDEEVWDRLRDQARERLDELVEEGYLTEADATDRLSDYDARIDIAHEEKVIIREYDDIQQIENDDLRQQYADLFGHPRRFQVLIWPTLSDRHVGVIKTIINADKQCIRTSTSSVSSRTSG